jgi:hypothetical protein
MDETLFNSEPRLSFPIRMAPASWGDMEEYEIPTNQKAAVLKRLYPFDPVPKMDDVMFDLHAERTFRVSDFRVVRDCGMNMLVSPYYPESGGTVIDWMPADIRPGESHSRRIRGRDESVMTYFLGSRENS